VWGRAEPSTFLVENAGLLPKSGRALDVAMGSGRNAVYLASLGFEVLGVDVSEVACGLAMEAAAEAGVRIEAVCADLGSWEVPGAAFDVVVNFNYLQRDLCPRLAAALRPGGVLVFQTFTTEQRQYGWGPSTDEFLLCPASCAGCSRSWRRWPTTSGPRKRARAEGGGGSGGAAGGLPRPPAG
jgi:2-polyprenyl-3-methyl-5-hydroxy-6-metoxy-1,4-benzoquinol methylase